MRSKALSVVHTLCFKLQKRPRRKGPRALSGRDGCINDRLGDKGYDTDGQ